MLIRRLVAFLLLFVAGALAAPPLTTIQDTLYSANGQPLNALATITWYAFESSDSSSIGQQTLTVQIINGSIYIQLVPNTTANPSSPYTVSYAVDGNTQYQETWMVPPSTSPLHVSDVRTSSTNITSPPGSSPGGGQVATGGSGTGPFPESSITGLAGDLASRPAKGSSYGASRVAVVDSSGLLETVVGNNSDCVYVSGSSGPCFDPTQLPQYSDGETPAGVVDGNNANFGLAGTPLPVQSLILFRNGILQKAGFDYVLANAALQFAAGNAPQPADTLVAWYRLASSATAPQSGGLGASPGLLATTTPQVICSANGTQTTSAAPTTLGTCTIPAGLLSPGDRVEMRFLYAHTGSSIGFNYSVVWGSTTIQQRAAGAGDAAVSGVSDASITTGATQIGGQSFGTILPLLPSLATASDSNAAPITIRFQGNPIAAGTDTAALVNYTVIRYPAISNP